MFNGKTVEGLTKHEKVLQILPSISRCVCDHFWGKDTLTFLLGCCGHLPSLVTNLQCFLSSSVSPTVPHTFEQMLEEQLFSKASQQLIEREELLFGQNTEEQKLKDHEAEVKSLAADYSTLRDRILQILLQSFSLDIESVKGLTSAVITIHQEHQQDQLWKQRSRTSPCWRPCRWTELHNKTVLSLVKARMDNPQKSSEGQRGMSSIMEDIFCMGKQLKDDLHFVVNVVKTCYPPEHNICQSYAELFHQAFSFGLKNIADFGLGDKDCAYLLRWVNEYYPE